MTDKQKERAKIWALQLEIKMRTQWSRLLEDQGATGNFKYIMFEDVRTLNNIVRAATCNDWRGFCSALDDLDTALREYFVPTWLWEAHYAN